MKIGWSALISFMCLFNVASGAEPEVLGLAKKHNCLACHSVEKKLLGPAWKDVAKKYNGKDDAKELLVERVKNGTKGNWGVIPMPPNVTVKDADIEKLIDFILSLK